MFARKTFIVILYVLATLGIAWLFTQPRNPLGAALFTAYWYTLVYGVTYYQIRWSMKFFRRKA